MQARTASLVHQVDTVAQRWKETGQRLKSYAEAIRSLSRLIEQLSLAPARTLLAVPASPDAHLHGLLVVQGLVRRIRAGTDTLQHEQVDLDASLAAARAAQQKAADMLDHEIAAAGAACAEAVAATPPLTQRNPRIALAALGAEQGAVKHGWKSNEWTKRTPVGQLRPASHDAAQANPTGLCAMTTGGTPRARLPPPVHGVIVKGWGEATDAGPAAGVSYQAPPGARVVAPCGGRVVFANSFRSYGRLLILDCGGGYHMVLSGLEKLDVQSGQTIGAGDAVGIMPVPERGSAARRQVLYIELRHNGSPVNPSLWLRNSS